MDVDQVLREQADAIVRLSRENEKAARNNSRFTVAVLARIQGLEKRTRRLAVSQNVSALFFLLTVLIIVGRYRGWW